MHKTVLFIVLILLSPSFAIAQTIPPIELTEKERAWLQDHKTIRISGPQAFPPFQYFDEKGVFKGMASDYIEHIAYMVGFNVEVAPKMTWNEVLTKVQNREIDVLSCAAKTKERATYINYTDSHLSFPLVIISKKDAPFVADIHGLHKMTVAFVKNNASYVWLQNAGVEFTPLFVGSPIEALEKVSMGEADAAIENLAAASYLIEKNGLTNLKIAAPTKINDYRLFIGVRKDWPELVSILNKGLAAIDQETHNRIRQQWIHVRYEHGIRPHDILRWVLIVGGVSASLLLLFYLWNRQLKREIEERHRVEKEKEALIRSLTGALDEIKTLRGILPICSSCKKIRDDKGYWTQIESYISTHLDTDFSHSICPDCMDDLYGTESWYASMKNDDSATAENNK